MAASPDPKAYGSVKHGRYLTGGIEQTVQRKTEAERFWQGGGNGGSQTAVPDR